MNLLFQCIIALCKLGIINDIGRLINNMDDASPSGTINSSMFVAYLCQYLQLLAK